MHEYLCIQMEDPSRLGPVGMYIIMIIVLAKYFITQIRYISGLRSVLSCCSDPDTALIVGR